MTKNKKVKIKKLSKKKIEQDYKQMMKIVWIGFAVILPILIVMEFFMHPHPYFGIDGILLFNAWYGFVACALIVVFSKILGFVLKRKTGYYKEEL